MIIATTFTVSFNKSDEAEKIKAFENNNNIGEFVKKESEDTISFTKTQTYINDELYCYII